MQTSAIVRPLVGLFTVGISHAAFLVSNSTFDDFTVGDTEIVFEPGFNAFPNYNLSSDKVSSQLAPAVLTAANFIQANLQGTDFSYADLSGGSIFDSNMVGAIFTNANLTGTSFDESSAVFTDFSFAEMAGASLLNTDLDSAIMTGANLSGANLTGANLALVDLSGVDFSAATLDNATSMVLAFWVEPPKYDENTSFIGTGFDPEAAGWTLVPEPSSSLLGALGILLIFRRSRDSKQIA